MKQALSLADLNKRIDSINSAANKLSEEYHEVGMLCLTHLKAHGDVGPVNRLLVGMPKGVRRLAMGVWVMKHGALAVNTDKGTKDTMPVRFDKGRETNLETAAATKWYDEVPERTLSDVFDLQVAVKRLIAQATRQGIKLKIGGEDKPHEAHSMLKMLAVGVGLPNPFAAEEAAAAEVVAKADAAAKEALANKEAALDQPQNPPAGSRTGLTRQTAQGEKPAVQREAKATAKAAKKTASKRGAKAHA